MEQQISKIEELFNAAKANGFKKPTLRTEFYLFKAAPEHGANPNAVYVTSKVDGEYLGKIKSSKFFGNMHHISKIMQIADNPMEAAINYGHKSGECSICGRRLDNAISVYNGIGPICAEKIGYPIQHPPVESKVSIIDTL